MWNKARISAVLANPVYKGTVIYGKTKVSKTSKKPSGAPRQFKTDETEQIVIENAHEPIVSTEDWDMAKDIREGRLTKPPSARIGNQFVQTKGSDSNISRKYSSQVSPNMYIGLSNT